MYFCSTLLDQEYWYRLAEKAITKKLNATQQRRTRAKNVILFIGDGMGVSTVTASRILRGQLNGKPGEETVLAFEEFPNLALSKVNRFGKLTMHTSRQIKLKSIDKCQQVRFLKVRMCTWLSARLSLTTQFILTMN